MASSSSIALAIAEHAPMLILDARLALAPGGLLLAVRLAREARVWLPGYFWDYLAMHREPRSSTDPPPLPEMDLWFEAWITGSLHRNFYWLDGERNKGSLPDGMDSWLPGRFQLMERGLSPFESRAPGEETGTDEFLLHCGFEAIALAGALAVHTPIILTTKPCAKSEPPPICAQAILESEEVPEGEVAALTQSMNVGRINAALAQMRLRMRQKGQTTREIVAVHVAVPYAVQSTDIIDRTEGAVPPFGQGRTLRARKIAQMQVELWREACLYWHPLE